MREGGNLNGITVIFYLTQKKTVKEEYRTQQTAQ